MNRLLRLVLAALLPIVPSATFAQSGADGDPDGAPGFTNSVFQSTSFDSVNLYNGSLTIPIAIGPKYPVGPKLKFQALLTYTSRIDEGANAGNFDGPVSLRTGDPAIGIGWIFTLGAIKRCSAGSNSGYFCYLAPDGSQHQFFAESVGSSYYKTQDASQFFLYRTGSTDDPTSFDMWDGEGNHHRFDWKVGGTTAHYDDGPQEYKHDFGRGRDGWYLTSLKDPFGNEIRANYYTTGAPCLLNSEAPFTCGGVSQSANPMVCTSAVSSTWILRQILLPTATINVNRNSDYLISSIDFPVDLNRTATWSFGYDTNSYTFGNCTFNSPPQINPIESIRRLTSITLPDSGRPDDAALTYLFSYGERCAGDLLTQVVLPNGGAIDYTWGWWNFYHGRQRTSRCDLSAPRPNSLILTSGAFVCPVQPPGTEQFPPAPDCQHDTSGYLDSVTGVIARAERPTGVGCDLASACAAWTQYTQYAFPFGESGLSACSSGSSCSQSLTVVVYPPDHDLKVRAKATLFWTGPRDPTSGPVVGDRVGADIEERDFDVDPTGLQGQPCGNAGSYPFCADHAIRVVRRAFEYDVPGNGNVGETGNRRIVQEQRYYSGLAADLSCSQCAYHQVNYSNIAGTWESNGRHFEREVHIGTLGGDYRRIETRWRAVVTENGVGTVWFPNLWDRRLETEDPSGSPSVTRSVYRYADYDWQGSPNGFLRGRVVWDGERNQLWGECYYRRAPGDSTDDPFGNVRSRYAALVTQGTEPSPQICTTSVPTPSSWGNYPGQVFGTIYTYQNSLRLTATPATGQVNAAWFSYRVERDATTGWVKKAYDTAGLETPYHYDLLGRVADVTPPGEDATVLSYPLAKTIAKRNSGTGALGTVNEYHYDGFGRTIRERRRMPGSSIYAKRFTLFDGRGNSFFESEWVDDGQDEKPATWSTTNSDCSYSGGTYSSARPLNAPGMFRGCFDPFGRPRLLVGASHSSLVSVDRTDSATTVPSLYSDTREASTTTCINGYFDASGACQQGSDSKTTSLKDAFGRLLQVTEPGGDITGYDYDVAGKPAHVYQGSQTRTLTHDRWGFLRQEITPEKGTVAYTYGAAGNVLTESYGAGTTNLVVTREYDLAGRLKKVKTDEGAGRTYIVNEYDETGRGSSMGKLTTSTSTNFALPGATTSVEDKIEYFGVGGRPSKKTTTTVGGTTLSTIQSWTYNTIGLVQKHSLPRPSGSIYDVTFTFDAGLPVTETADTQLIVSSVVYQPSGALKEFKTGINTLVKTSINQDGYLPRPAQITTNGAAQDFDSGTYSYDGAGNIRSVVKGTKTDSFGYDLRSRLTSANVWDAAGAFNHPEGFIYDRWGNVTARQVEDQLFVVPINPDTNRLSSGSTYDYDLRGNLTKNDVSNFEFDGLSRQTRFWVSGTTDEHYVYDSAGERIGKVNPTLSGLTLGASFYAMTPCRLLDTRFVGSGAPIPGGTVQTYGTSTCGIPVGARAIAANVTSINPPTTGFFRLFPAGSPLTSATVNAFRPYNVRATQTFLSIDGPNAGSYSIYGDYPTNVSVHVIVDAFGYFMTPAASYVPSDTYTLRDEQNRLTTEYLVDGSGTSVTKDYFYFGSSLVASHVPSGAWNFYATDHLATPRLIFDGSGATVTQNKLLPSGAPMGAGIAFGPNFAGMEKDAVSGNHYDHARSYSYWAMRFLSPDQLGGHPGDPQSWNRYSYARNSPLKFVDPNGQEIVISSRYVDPKFRPGFRVYDVRVTVEISGRHGVVPRASQVRAFKTAAEEAFTGSFGRYAGTLSMDVRLSANGNTDPSRHQVVVDPQTSRASAYVGGTEISMSPDDSGLVGAHELGHSLGLQDEYRDVEGRGSVALPGFENNLMGTGILHGRNDLSSDQFSSILRNYFAGALNQTSAPAPCAYDDAACNARAEYVRRTQ